jgi:hypothetical protein
LLERISKAVESIGLHRLNLSKVHRFLTTDPEGQSGRVPSTTTLRKILRDQFLLRFRPINAAHIKYNDTEYDSKRAWVSRLLT